MLEGGRLSRLVGILQRLGANRGFLRQVLETDFKPESFVPHMGSPRPFCGRREPSPPPVRELHFRTREKPTEFMSFADVSLQLNCIAAEAEGGARAAEDPLNLTASLFMKSLQDQSDTSAAECSGSPPYSYTGRRASVNKLFLSSAAPSDRLSAGDFSSTRRFSLDDAPEAPPTYSSPRSRPAPYESLSWEAAAAAPWPEEHLSQQGSGGFVDSGGDEQFEGQEAECPWLQTDENPDLQVMEEQEEAEAQQQRPFASKDFILQDAEGPQHTILGPETGYTPSDTPRGWNSEVALDTEEDEESERRFSFNVEWTVQAAPPTGRQEKAPATRQPLRVRLQLPHTSIEEETPPEESSAPLSSGASPPGGKHDIIRLLMGRESKASLEGPPRAPKATGGSAESDKVEGPPTQGAKQALDTRMAEGGSSLSLRIKPVASAAGESRELLKKASTLRVSLLAAQCGPPVDAVSPASAFALASVGLCVSVRLLPADGGHAPHQRDGQGQALSSLKEHRCSNLRGL